MKRMIVYCCVGGCENVLDVTDSDVENPEFTLYECVGDQCQECKDAQSKPKPTPKFNNPKFGHTNVTATSDFETMMAKRKLENRTASGKGAGRANR